MGARPYNPTLGRLLAVDPVDGGSLNAYDYAGQDPINGYDLDGSVKNADFNGVTPFVIFVQTGNVTTATYVQSFQTSSTSDAVWTRTTTTTTNQQTGKSYTGTYDRFDYYGKSPYKRGTVDIKELVWYTASIADSAWACIEGAEAGAEVGGAWGGVAGCAVGGGAFLIQGERTKHKVLHHANPDE